MKNMNKRQNYMAMKRITEDTKRSVEFWLAILLIIAGVTLLFLGFYAVPIGEISASVLTAFGEIGTFSGSVMGIDYNYRYKRDKLEYEGRKHDNNEANVEDSGKEAEYGEE